MKLFEWTAYILVTIGALSFGVDKLFNFNFIVWLLSLGGLSNYAFYLYWAIGLAGVYAVFKIRY